ncbi:MAG: ChaN family lipoprotein [Nitrospinae bacterium]|nr:ChaN family lipoprotein [Nitrospinota bacterium]
MNRTPVHLAIKIVLGTLFLIWLLSATQKGSAEEYAVPNSGSPYINLKALEIDQILHIPTGIQVTKDQMIEIVSGSRVIYVGETHDNLEAHRAQLEVIERLAKKFPGKITVGMEMFRQSAQPALDRWHNGDLPQSEFKTLFHKNWGPGFNLYQPIFDFVKENSIPLIGLKSSKETESQFRKEGTEASPGSFPEMDESDIHHKTFSMSIFGGHADHAEALKKPYQMLLLWEETMAQTVAEFLKNNPDRKLVVLAGGFHVQYGFGIPKRAFRRIPHAYSIILPTVTELPPELKDREMDVEYVSIPLYAGDFAWRLEYKVLPENKVKLGIQLKESESEISVLFVGENSNAEKAGILKGDVLLALSGEKILNVDDLVTRLQTFNIGDHATVRLRRGMEELDVEVLLRKATP